MRLATLAKFGKNEYGQKGGRKTALLQTSRRCGVAAMANRDTSLSALCIKSVTLYRYVDPQGQKVLPGR